MADGLIDARWVAPFEAELPDKTVLVPHETVVQISEAEAEASDHWHVVGSQGSSGPTAKEIRAELESRGVEIPKGSKKADLESLLAVANGPAPEPEPEPEDPDQGAED